MNGEWEDFGRKSDQNMKDKRAPVSVRGNMVQEKTNAKWERQEQEENNQQENTSIRERAVFDSREHLYQILLSDERE